MKKIISFLMIVIVILSVAGCGNAKEEQISDAIKFKEEYEKINGVTNSSGNEHRTISIPEDNPFVYTNGEEIVEKIENNETFYVYFGSSYCPWCRSVIETAIKVAKENNIKTIYYVDIWDGDHVEILRDTYKLNDDGEPEVVFAGGKSYKDLLKCFDNVLGDYTLTDTEGNNVSVGEKRIFAPNFIYVEKGVAKRIIEGISEKQTSSRMNLTEEILKDEEKQFNEFFNNENYTCSINENC